MSTPPRRWEVRGVLTGLWLFRMGYVRTHRLSIVASSLESSSMALVVALPWETHGEQVGSFLHRFGAFDGG